MVVFWSFVISIRTLTEPTTFMPPQSSMTMPIAVNIFPTVFIVAPGFEVCGSFGSVLTLMLRIVCGLIVCTVTSLSTMPSGYVKQFGHQLRRLREARDISQEALASTAKLHRTHISLIERGQRSVRLETIERLARALGLQPRQLMPPIAPLAASTRVTDTSISRRAREHL